MTKDEALKLALEALEANHFLIHGSETKGGLAFCMDGYYSGCFDIDSNDKQTNKAITAIKEALANEALEKMAENARELGLDYEPEQPKVRTGDCLLVGVCASEGHKIAPQRKPLTDEEVNKLVDDEDWYNDPHGFVRAIEAAHGIKENG